MHNEDVKNYIFMWSIETPIIVFYKLITHIVFSVLLDALQRVWVNFAKTFKDSKIWSACVVLICFPVVIWHQTTGLNFNLDFGKTYQIHHIILTNSIKLTWEDICLTELACNPHVVNTSRSTLEMATEQRPFIHLNTHLPQNPPVVANVKDEWLEPPL